MAESALIWACNWLIWSAFAACGMAAASAMAEQTNRACLETLIGTVPPRTFF
ncbi:hypothetical protein [Acidiphilium sp. 34-64-41]|uniref:hypothetical protein n=1 Tax=Acidiphilium sp. 34-64-41 TaxID=1970297 RepID=UPI00257CBC7F|nr:hypothetical protein [Acidiphilium sp. 34-64-41]